MKTNGFDNVVLISIDTLRFDCVSYQKQKLIDKKLLRKYLKTPNLDKIIKNSVCFTNVFATAPYTTNSHASLFTGKLPVEHKIREFFYFGEKIPDKIETLGSFFKKNGYQTFSMSDMSFMFEKLDILRDIEYKTDKDSQFIEIFPKYKKKKNFIFTHFFDVHDPYLYSPSDILVDNRNYYQEMNSFFKKYGVKYKSMWNNQPYDLWKNLASIGKLKSKELLPLYLQGISKFDQFRLKFYMDFFDRNLDEDNTVYFIFSDHGEGQCYYNDTKYFFHGPHISNEVIRVPVMIYNKNIKFTLKENFCSLINFYSLLTSLIKKPKLESIYNFSINDNFIYSESFSGNKKVDQLISDSAIKKTPWRLLKKDNFLYERKIINTKKFEECIINRSPEKISFKYKDYTSLLNILRNFFGEKYHLNRILYIFFSLPFFGKFFLKIYFKLNIYKPIVFNELLNNFEDVEINKILFRVNKKNLIINKYIKKILLFSNKKFNPNKCEYFFTIKGCFF